MGELHRAARAALALRERRQSYPLAYRQLWRQPSPMTSQRAALARVAEPGVLLACILGGNRTGKSDAAMQWAVCSAAGRDAVHEGREGPVYWVRRWLALNGYPVSFINKGPASVWTGSPTFGAAVEQCRPKLASFCPAGTKVSGLHSTTSEATFTLPNGGRIVSKAYRQFEQNPQTWEGAAIRAAALDEQPESYALLSALFARLIDLKGSAVLALTPLRGKHDWFYREIVRNPPNWARVSYLHGGDNPHIDQEMRELAIAAAPAWQRASRDRGGITDPEGRIYAFDRASHVVDPFEPPREWIRWQSTDWGSRAPHVIWAAEDPSGVLWVYRELAPRRSTVEPGVPARRLIMWAHEAEEGTPEGMGLVVCYRVADSEDPGAIEEAAESGWLVAPATKGPGSVLKGIELVDALISTVDPLDMSPVEPRIRITNDCPVLIEEMEGMRWAEKRDAGPPKPDKSCPDHGPDALRYLVQYRQELGFR